MGKNEQRLDYVDTLRGIAILMVIMAHTSYSMRNLSALVDGLSKYCQMGVQLFFVVSAYTICRTYEKRAGEAYPISSFYIRRFFRIAPLYYLAIPMYYLFHIAGQLHKGASISSEPYSIFNISTNILFLHGFVPSANNIIVPGGWAIGTEIAFYLCFPLLFAIAMKQRLQSAPNYPVFALLIFCVGSNLLIQAAFADTSYSMRNNNFIYFNILNQLPVFIVGIIAYFLHKHESQHPIASSKILQIFGMITFSAFALLLWWSKKQLMFAAIPTISAISFLFLLNFLKLARCQSNVLCKIGEVSFSMYIFHILFIWGLAPAIIRRVDHLVNPDLLLLFVFLLMTALTFFVARLSARVIESQGIAVGARLISQLQTRANLLIH